MHHDAERTTAPRVEEDLQAVDALVHDADGDQIWRVLDYAARHSVSVAAAYQVIIGDLPAGNGT